MAQVFKLHKIQIEEAMPEVVLAIPAPPPISEQELMAAKEESFQQGYSQGRDDANTISQQQMDKVKEQLERLLCSIPQALEQQRLALQQDIAALSIHIIQSYFTEQILDKKILETNINRLLAQINSQQSIELYLHSTDIKALQSGAIQLNAIKNQITIKSDEALALGGFIIKTPHGNFDASIENQINKLKDYLIHMKCQELP
jgi:flagellar assembly protein FliH